MTKRTILILLFSLGVLFILFFWLLFPNKWSFYSNSRYNFSMEYPSTWQMGEEEVGSSGRTFKDKKTGVECYIYGFQNVLYNTEGDVQNLEEFVDWLIEDEDSNIFKVLDREPVQVSDLLGAYLLSQEGTTVKESVYVLGKDMGIGFFCLYKDLEQKKKYEETFNSMVDSIEIFSDLDGETISSCINLLNGVLEPLIDLKAIEDDKYTEVTLVSREFWDKQKLPQEVVDLAGLDYDCLPSPFQYDSLGQEGGSLSQPNVISVLWECELRYQEWQYLEMDHDSERSSLERQGFNCKQESCLDDDEKMKSVWLCTK